MFSILVKRSHGLTQPGEDDETFSFGSTCRREVRGEVPRAKERRLGAVSAQPHAFRDGDLDAVIGHCSRSEVFVLSLPKQVEDETEALNGMMAKHEVRT
jgi:hypothetical protein